MRTTNLYDVAVAFSGLAVGLLLGSGLMLLLAPSVEPVPGVAPAVVQLQEDDPGWDCRTMGNRMCGEETR